MSLLESSDTEDEEMLPSNTTIERIMGEDLDIGLPVVNYVYIDDFNAVERVGTRFALSHITTQRRKIQAHAPKSEAYFNHVYRRAGEIGMKVNEEKTQILCISAAKNSKVESYINAPSARIRSGEQLKILGFWFDERPGVEL